MSVSGGEFVAEVGCGPGINMHLLANELGMRGRIVGIDIDDRSLALSRSYFENEAELLRADANVSIPLRSSSTQVLLFWFSLHYCSSLQHILSEAARALKQDGYVFIVTLSHDQIRNFYFADLFPEAIEYNIDRYPDIDSVVAAGSKVGLSVHSEKVFTGHDRLNKEQVREFVNYGSSALGTIPIEVRGSRLEQFLKDTECTRVYNIPVTYTGLVLRRTP